MEAVIERQYFHRLDETFFVCANRLLFDGFVYVLVHYLGYQWFSIDSAFLLVMRRRII